MHGPNLSEWALRHQSFILFLIVALGLAGAYSYNRLGQAEDPAFTFKLMLVRTVWPGATAREVEQQVTERLEKKLQEVPWFDYTRSYSRPGESMIFVTLKDYTPPKEVPNDCYQARKKLSDIRHTLPSSVRGPFFNDEFGDTFGTIYAFTSDGYAFSELRDYVDRARDELLRVTDVSKIEMIGDQEEKIYVEISHRKLATLGIDPGRIFEVLAAQNNVSDARMEYLIRDRLSWLRFLGFDLGAPTPDANTVRVFRERLTDIRDVVSKIGSQDTSLRYSRTGRVDSGMCGDTQLRRLLGLSFSL